jgi:rhodanese-related sulfurtransferase
MKTILNLILCCIIFSIQSCAQKPEGVVIVDADSMKTLIKDEHAIILDVRTPEEYAEGHLPGAINIDYRNEKFEEGLDTLNKDLVYDVYCRSGNRSLESTEIMKKKGFKNIYHFEGGFTEWEKKGFPVVK